MTIFRGPNGRLYIIEQWINKHWQHWWGDEEFVAHSIGSPIEQIQLNSIEDYEAVAYC